MNEKTESESCKMCKGLLPIDGGHIIILDDIHIRVCTSCFKGVVNTCIEKIHRGLPDHG